MTECPPQLIGAAGLFFWTMIAFWSGVGAAVLGTIILHQLKIDAKGPRT